MKTQCPFCKKVFKAPEIYKGKMVHCPDCKEYFLVSEYHEPVIPPETVEKAKKKANGIFLALWKRIPGPFKTGFFTTLGVMAAMVVGFNLYIGYIRFPETVSTITAKELELDKYRFTVNDKSGPQWEIVGHWWLKNPNNIFMRYWYNAEFLDKNGNLVAHTTPVIGTEPPHKNAREVTSIFYLDAVVAEQIDFSRSKINIVIAENN